MQCNYWSRPCSGQVITTAEHRPGKFRMRLQSAMRNDTFTVRVRVSVAPAPALAYGKSKQLFEYAKNEMHRSHTFTHDSIRFSAIAFFICIELFHRFQSDSLSKCTFYRIRCNDQLAHTCSTRSVCKARYTCLLCIVHRHRHYHYSLVAIEWFIT